MTDSSATKDSSRANVFNVDVEKLAKVYAQAALDAAGQNETQLLEELRAIVDEVLDGFPDIEQVFGSALVSLDEKLEMLDRVFGTRVGETTLSFLKVLTKHDRLGALRDVVRVAGELWEQRSNRIPVNLELALDVDSGLQEEIVDSLRKSLGVDPVVSKTINPDLIGGFVVRVGDKVYDASTRASLERSRQAMVASAVEAIQNSPEQFLDKTSD